MIEISEINIGLPETKCKSCQKKKHNEGLGALLMTFEGLGGAGLGDKIMLFEGIEPEKTTKWGSIGLTIIALLIGAKLIHSLGR